MNRYRATALRFSVAHTVVTLLGSHCRQKEMHNYKAILRG